MLQGKKVKAAVHWATERSNEVYCLQEMFANGKHHIPLDQHHLGFFGLKVKFDCQ